jgi:hypothetical protein
VEAERAHRPGLRLVSDADLAADSVTRLGDHPSESLAKPGPGRFRGVDDQCLRGVDRAQLERVEPDRERALADRCREQLADVLPVGGIRQRRCAEAGAIASTFTGTRLCRSLPRSVR